jgi:BASS family bile acid:Na+ symporter
VFEFFKSIIPYTVPVFVIFTMLNVGLTQKLSVIIAHLKNFPFVLRMLIANFIVAPLLMVIALKLTSFDPALEAGLLVFSLCAGAPFLIKLTEAADQNVALGAAVMMLLMVGTVIYLPIVLPLFLSGVTVDAWDVAKSLLLQMILPIAVGMLTVQFLPVFTKRVQPWIGWVGNITLYIVIAATLIGYLPNMLEIFGTGAILVGLAFVAAAFGIGRLAGKGQDHLEDVGELGTAQRNTAAGLIIAAQNFRDPNVLVMLTLANTLGIVMLLLIARALSRDNKVKLKTV